MGKPRRTLEEFISQSKKVHGDVYCYSQVEYINSQTKIKIICKIHGIFEQVANSHIWGCGCPKCYGNVRLTTNDVVDMMYKVHGDRYDYSLVEHVSVDSKVKIICKIHGIFEQTPHNHIHRMQGCKLCSYGELHVKFKSTLDRFIKMAIIIHGDKYDYSLVEYINAHTKIKIICKKHGMFEQTANSHIHGCGCPKCKSSKGELNIEIYLKENNIKYLHQHRFSDCRYKITLPFDFYLPEYNMCVEYDGEQHYESISYFGGDVAFDELKEKDTIKTEYCLNNNIKLLRIPYWDFDRIEYILDETLTNP